MQLMYCVLYLAALGILSHFIGEALPREWFHWQAFPYRSLKWERGGAIYERLGIRRWKDIVPDMSRILPNMFPKRVLSGEAGKSSAMRLIQETCVAECIHAALIVAGFGCFYFLPGTGGYIVFAVWTVFGNLPFIIIQRYNRPRLIKLAARLHDAHAQGKR